MSGLEGAFAGGVGPRLLAGEAGTRLEQGDDLLPMILAGAHAGIVVVDPLLCCRVWNPFMEQVTGRLASEVVGRSVLDAFPFSREHGAADLLAQALAGEVVTIPDMPCNVSSTGQCHWISARFGPLRSAAGATRGIIGTVHDVTHRRLAEAGARASEEGWGELIDSLNVGVFQSYLTGRFAHVNLAIARMAGYDSVDEVLSISTFRLYADPCDRDRLIETLRRDGAVKNFELPSVRKDGSRYWVSMNAVLLPAKPGRPDSLLGVVKDITEVKSVERALRESEERLRKIFEQSPMSMAIVGMDGTIERINQKAIEVFGYLPDDIPTMEHWWVLAYPDEDYRREVVATWTGLTEKAIANGTEIEGREYRVTCQDGNVKTMFILGVPVAEKVFVMFEDITERKRFEEQLVELNRILEERVEERTRELQQSYEQLTRISRLVPGVLYQFQMFPDGHFRFPYVSEAVRDLFAQAPEEVLDDATRALSRVHRADLAGLLASIQESARTMRPWHHEFRVVLPSQGERFYVGDSRPQQEPDGSILWHGFITDISDRKRVEEALRVAKDAAEEATRAKSQFLANMSHEIRTPMNAIMGLTDLVLDSRLTDEQRQQLSIVQARSMDLLVLINDILDLSKIEAQRVELVMETFVLASVLSEVHEMFAREAARKGVRLFTVVAPSAPATVTGDLRRLRQVLVNLVGNAVKFTETGEVELGVDCVSTEVLTGDVTLHFRVRDTGIGISRDKQEMIFDIFAQANATLTRQYGGAGLGLSIARRLVEMMGGRIWLESEPGRGSTFQFTVNLAPGPCVALPQGSTRPRPASLARSLSVLVVEDDDSSRYLVEALLKKQGHRVTAVDSGREALSVLAEADFDLVVMDVQMPDMNGMEVTRLIRDLRSPVRNHDVPVIALTALAMSGDENRCLEAGMTGYVSKPVSAATLSGAIESAMAER